KISGAIDRRHLQRHAGSGERKIVESDRGGIIGARLELQNELNPIKRGGVAFRKDRRTIKISGQRSSGPRDGEGASVRGDCGEAIDRAVPDMHVCSGAVIEYDEEK